MFSLEAIHWSEVIRWSEPKKKGRKFLLFFFLHRLGLADPFMRQESPWGHPMVRGHQVVRAKKEKEEVPPFPHLSSLRLSAHPARSKDDGRFAAVG